MQSFDFRCEALKESAPGAGRPNQYDASILFRTSARDITNVCQSIDQTRGIRGTRQEPIGHDAHGYAARALREAYDPEHRVMGHREPLRLAEFLDFVGEATRRKKEVDEGLATESIDLRFTGA